jgi:hypothetical protein
MEVRAMASKPVHLPSVLFLVLVAMSALPATDVAAGHRDQEAPALVWKDAEDGHILFTSADIISFDWDKQVFLLKETAILDFLAWVPPHRYQFRRLVVQDTRGTIYEGCWVNGVSSMGFFEPVYVPLSPNPFFSIVNGYPSSGSGGVPREQDPRFAERLRAGLQKAGVLEEIDLTFDYVGLRIQTTGHSWKDCGKDLKIRVEFIENTFRIGAKARAHIFFAGGEKTLPEMDAISLDIKFVANTGRFRSECHIERIPPSVVHDGIYVCQFSPWEGIPGSESQVEWGTGYISLSVVLEQEEEGEEGNRLVPVYRLDFPESTVPISGPIMTAGVEPTPDRS